MQSQAADILRQASSAAITEAMLSSLEIHGMDSWRGDTSKYTAD